MPDEEVVCLHHEPCPSCGSRDNLARYSDGHGYCFGCGHYEGGDGQPTARRKKQAGMVAIQGEIQAIEEWGITERTCQHWGYRVTEKGSHLAYHFDADRNATGFKARKPGKKFSIKGELPGLYGEWLWAPGGKMLVITEGEKDALTVSQLQENKWPVVSVPNGAQGAAKSIKNSFEYVSSFESVILMFDMDEPGQAAAKECAELLDPGKAKLATLPMKDAHECFAAGKGKDVINAIWRAQPYHPDGIVDGRTLFDRIKERRKVPSIPYPWEYLTKKTRGIRLREIVTFCAGSGIGKSAVVREVIKYVHDLGETVGVLMLEEDVEKTSLEIMGLHLNKRIYVNDEDIPETEFVEAFDATVGSGRFFLYDHFGSSEVDRLLSRIRYMVKVLECKYLVLDHLSIVVSDLAETGETDERKTIDKIMTRLRKFVQETEASLFLVSHLKGLEGRGHEEGAHTALNQLRGSRGIGQLSDIVVGLERNQQSDNPNETFIRILKNRFSGETGPAGSLHYNSETGRLTEMEAVTEGGF